MADQSSIQDLACEEKGGVMMYLKRRIQVEGLTTKSAGVLIEALNHPSVPRPNSRLRDFPGLVLLRRNPRVHPDDPSVVQVDLEYENWRTAIFNPEVFQFRVTGGSALRQDQTQFDGYGNQIILQHTFASDDYYHPGETVTQGAQVSILRPSCTLRFEGAVRTSFPHYIAYRWNGHINSWYWAGGAPYTWMCTDVQFDLLDITNDDIANGLGPFVPFWMFSFEFLYDPNTHIPVAIFNDPSRGGPPPNLVANVGYKLIDYYPARDFHQLIPGLY